MTTLLGQKNWMFMAKFLSVQFYHKLNKYVQSDRMQKNKLKLMKNPMI
jgi:hypothetical protein